MSQDNVWEWLLEVSVFQHAAEKATTNRPSSNFVRLWSISSVSLRTTNCPGRSQGHVIKFWILHPMKYLRNGESYLLTSNFVHGLATSSCTKLQMANCPVSGRGQGHATHSRFSRPWNISGTASVISVTLMIRNRKRLLFVYENDTKMMPICQTKII